jgi:oligosaccharide repeat unit polymerase
VKVAFAIAVAYASLGLLYDPGWSSILALVFVTTACAPWLFASFCDTEGIRYPPPGFLLFWLLLALGLLNLGVIAASIDRAPSDLLSVEGVASAAVESTIRRYEERAASGHPVLLALSLFLIFRVGAAAQKVGVLKKLLAFAPVVAYTILTTEKLPALLAIMFFLSGVVMSTPPSRALRRFSTTAAFFVLVGGAVGATAVLMRAGLDSESSKVGLTLIHYVLSPYSGFGHWLHDHGMRACCTLGEQTFAGPFNALGLAPRKQGIFEEYFVINGLPGNIYTAWRFIIEDFSVVGPLVLNSILAAAFVALQSHGLRFLSAPVKLFVVLGALLSLATTPFAYNSLALTFALAAGYTFIVSYPFRRSRLSPSTLHRVHNARSTQATIRFDTPRLGPVEGRTE